MSAKNILIVGTLVVLTAAGLFWALRERNPEEVASSPDGPVARVAVAVHTAPEGPAALLEVAGAEDPEEKASIAISADEIILEPATKSATPIFPPDEAKENEEPPTSSISGHVIDEFGEPVPGATVVIGFALVIDGRRDLGTMSRVENLYKTLADSKGLFQVTGIHHRQWALLYAEVDGLQGRAAVDLREGGVVEDVEIVLKDGVPLMGRVVSARGKPIPNAHVHVMATMPSLDSASRDPYAITDESGHFQLVFPYPCSAYLLVRSVTGETLFQDVPVGADTVIELRLEQPATVFGSLTFGDGQPAEGLGVFLHSRRGLSFSGDSVRVTGTGLSYSSVSDQEGSYEISGVFPDTTYHIVLKTDSDTEISRTRALGDLQPGQAMRQDFTLDELIHVKGVVVGKAIGRPLHGVGVTLIAGSDSPIRPDEALSTTVNEQGEFEYDVAIDPGPYLITPYYKYVSLRLAAKAFGQSVQLNHGKTTEVTLRMDAPFAVALRVVDGEGDPVPNAYIGFRWTFEDGAMGFAANWRPDEDGLFSWDGFAPFGAYSLRVGARGYLSAESATYQGQPGEIFPIETIALYRSAGMEGVALDAQGNPLVFARLSLSAYADLEELASFSLTTTRNGYFSTQDQQQLPATIVTLRINTSGDDATYSWSSEPIEFLPNEILDIGEIILEEQVNQK